MERQVVEREAAARVLARRSQGKELRVTTGHEIETTIGQVSSMSCKVAPLRSQVTDHSLYLWDLQVVELLLPLEDVVDAGQPHVDVAHQDAPANVDGQTIQCQAQVLQQLLDQARVVLVLYDWRGVVVVVLVGGVQNANNNREQQCRSNFFFLIIRAIYCCIIFCNLYFFSDYFRLT